MSYGPVKVIIGGELSFRSMEDGGGLLIRNWTFNMGDRPGKFEDYRCEVLFAIRDHMNAHFDAMILMMDDEQFGDARNQDAFIDQIMLAPGTFPTPKKRSLWQKLRGWLA